MTEREDVKQDEVFFSFDSNDEIYEIVIPEDDQPIYGSVFHKKDNEKEFLNIETWVIDFIHTFGYENPIEKEEVLTLRNTEEESLLFHGPFGYLKISKGCNLTYERLTT